MRSLIFAALIILATITANADKKGLICETTKPVTKCAGFNSDTGFAARDAGETSDAFDEFDAGADDVVTREPAIVIDRSPAVVENEIRKSYFKIRQERRRHRDLSANKDRGRR